MGVSHKYCQQEEPEVSTGVCLTAFAHARYLEQSRCGIGVRVTMYLPFHLRLPGLLGSSSIADA